MESTYIHTELISDPCLRCHGKLTALRFTSLPSQLLRHTEAGLDASFTGIRPEMHNNGDQSGERQRR